VLFVGIWVVAGATSLIYYNLLRLTLIGPEMTDMIHSGPVQSQATVSWASLRCVGRGEEREGRRPNRKREREGGKPKVGREHRERRERECVLHNISKQRDV
jgi:hypothetical protein